jgi:hypothetical protein
MNQNRGINHPTHGSSVIEVLERVLDKGVVIYGDISIALADIELLTIKIRLVVASVEKAQQIGIDWWKDDPHLSSLATDTDSNEGEERENTSELEERLARLEDRLLEEKKNK